MQNGDGSKFCRFCGVALLQGSGNPSHKPYGWQSEEFPGRDRTQNYQSKQTQVFSPAPQPQYRQPDPHPQRVQPLSQMQQTMPPMQQMQQMASPLYGQPYSLYGQVHLYCPNCHTQVVPQHKRKISQAGWIVFAILLVTIPPLFWIGLCIREDAKVCPICYTRIG
jgi:hypothetical protein